MNSLHTRIMAGTIGIVMLVGIVLMVLVHASIRQKLDAVLEKRGSFMVKELANECATPILTGRLFELGLQLRDLQESDSDIAYYFVLNRRGDVVAHTFSEGFPADLKSLGNVLVYHVEHLDTEQGKIVDFAEPIMDGKLGTVHLGISLRFLEQDLRDINRLFFGIIAVAFLIGITAAVFFARAITRPVKDLVIAAKAVGGGDLDHQVTIHGRDEIGELAAAFQDMIQKRKLVEGEREALIARLENAIKNITTLEGLLPICASCKRIRDENGAWNQIEVYVSSHTNAEFSHGICPECAKKVYPDFFKDKP